MGIGKKIGKAFHKVDRGVAGIGRKAEGALGSVNKFANKAERAVEKTVNKAEKVYEKGIDTANKTVQQAGKVGAKAVDVGSKIAKKVDRGLDLIDKTGVADLIPGGSAALSAARGVSESAKRGLGAADKAVESVKRTKVTKSSVRQAVMDAQKNGAPKVFV